MGRPRGSKNKITVPAQILEKGNPDFQITPEMDEAAKEKIAMSAITDEDIALDRELEMMSRNSTPDFSDVEPPPLKKSIEPYTLLSEYEDDYKPATSLHELDDQVFRAKQNDADSIEADPKIIRYFTKKDYPDKVGYFIYHDIKVYIAGFFAQSKLREQVTIEQKLFGASKIK